MNRKFKNFIHLCKAIAANVWYGFPSRSVTVIGVTGTDGKTTTTSLIYHALKTSGKKTAMITSVGAYIGNTIYDVGFHVTTPSSFAIQQYIRKAVQEGNTHVVLEITSHALDQYRAWGIHFNIGVLTNITHEHLDYHKTYAAYVKSKSRLLTASDIVVLNKQDDSYAYVLKYLHTDKIKTYAESDASADMYWKKSALTTSLVGKFNKANILAAWSVCEELGITKKMFQKALHTFSLPPGRQEVIKQKNPCVMVDFAHTPNALAQILPELKEKTKGRLIHVFGSAGERDFTKRPKMGLFSSQSADIIILTSEDPRSESAEQIAKQIRSGMIKGFRDVDETYTPGPKAKKIVFTITDRKKAIAKAISIAGNGDMVVCTGKGHETSMNYGNGETPWNEKQVILDILKR